MRRAAAAMIALLLAPVSIAGCSHLVVLHDPLSAAEHNDLGVAYETHGEPALARHEYQEAVGLDPRLARAWINLGNAVGAAGHWVEAEDCYRRAVLLDPGQADAMNNLAVALLHARRQSALDEADDLARRAVATGGARDSIYRATLGEVMAARARHAGTASASPAADGVRPADAGTL
jgi:Flp pilus assembly protein TadD